MNVEKATNWNTLYGIYHGNHMVDSLTDTVFFSDLLPERCPALDHSLEQRTGRHYCRSQMLCRDAK